MSSAESAFAGPSTLSIFRRVITAWRSAGPFVERPTIAEVIQRHPEIPRHKSLLLELALEDYVLRRAAGESIDPVEYSAQVPNYRRSLQRLLVLHDEFASIWELAPSRRVAWPNAGEGLGPFILDEPLGQGASSRVFLGRLRSMGDRPLVIKVSPRPTVETDAIGRLSHPHIVPVLSQYVVAQGPWVLVTMPYLGRRTLEDLLDATQRELLTHDGNWRIEVVRRWRQLTDALALAHERGIVHGDLKPSNVLVDDHGQPRLMDFHLAAPIGQVMAGVRGTLPYMAPEQLESLTAASRPTHVIDPRTDLFALGTLAVEMLTGQLPFGAADDAWPLADMIAQHVARRRVPLAPDILHAIGDDELSRLVAWCLAPELDQRCPSAIALRDQLDTYLAQVVRRDRRYGLVRRIVGLTIVGSALAALTGAAAWQALRPARNSPATTESAKVDRLEDSPTALHEYRAAARDWAENRQELALKRLGICQRIASSDPRVWIAIGHVYRDEQDLRKVIPSRQLAIIHYAHANAIDDTGRAAAYLAESYWRNAEFAAAVEAGESALRAGRTSAELYVMLSQSYARLRRDDDALQALQTAQRLDAALVTGIPSDARLLETKILQYLSREPRLPSDFPAVE